MEQAIAHERATGANPREAVERYVRESAFTMLNRLAALKLMEAPSRRLIRESVGREIQSSGFKELQLVTPLLGGATSDGGYRLYLELLEPGGLLGAITSRTGFFLSSFRKWREDILLKEARPTVFADLGYGVLDTAMVETAAY
jgi:hypothetical protein